MVLPGAPLLPGVWRCGCGFVNYGHTVTAALALALTIGTRLDAWLRERRALLASLDHVAAEVDRHRADWSDHDDPFRLARSMRDDRDEAFDGLRWFAHFARYNCVAAGFGGYTVR